MAAVRLSDTGRNSFSSALSHQTCPDSLQSVEDRTAVSLLASSDLHESLDLLHLFSSSVSGDIPIAGRAQPAPPG